MAASLLVFFDDDVELNYNKAEIKSIVRKLKRKLERASTDETVYVSVGTRPVNEGQQEMGHNAESVHKKRKKDMKMGEAATDVSPSPSKQCFIHNTDVNNELSITGSLVTSDEETDSIDSGIGSSGTDKSRVREEYQEDLNQSRSTKQKRKKLSSRLRRLLAAKERRQKAVSDSNHSDPTQIHKHCQHNVSLCSLCGKARCQTSDRSTSIKRTDSVPNSAKLPKKSMIVSLDCEFVGVGPNKRNALGRCSIVDLQGQVLCDVYVKPEEQITDYRTPWSGIRKRDLKKAIPFDSAQNSIRNLIKDKIVVGHAVHNDFRVLRIHHPAGHIRDTSKYPGLRSMAGFPVQSRVSLKSLSHQLLGRRIQTGEHCSVEDARATLDLYKLVQRSWEQELLDFGKALNSCECAMAGTVQNTESFLDDVYWPDDIIKN